MAPVVGDGEAGFRYDADEGNRFELPGLWLNSDELHALLAAQQLPSRSGGGVPSSALAPLQGRIEKLLSDRKRVVEGKGVSDHVYLGCRRNIKTKNKKH